MDKFTKDRDLTRRENVIKEWIASGDKRYYNVLNSLYNYYRLDYLRGKPNYIFVFNAIYIDNVKLPYWELANYCHVCTSTLYDYRHDIIDFFYVCLRENVTTEEVAVTKE